MRERYGRFCRRRPRRKNGCAGCNEKESDDFHGRNFAKISGKTNTCVDFFVYARSAVPFGCISVGSRLRAPDDILRFCVFMAAAYLLRVPCQSAGRLRQGAACRRRDRALRNTREKGPYMREGIRPRGRIPSLYAQPVWRPGYFAVSLNVAITPLWSLGQVPSGRGSTKVSSPISFTRIHRTIDVEGPNTAASVGRNLPFDR